VDYLALFVVFCICIAILLFYHLYFHIRLLFVTGKELEARATPVSIIVVANNEFDNLQSLIPKLLEQDHPQFEIILVDDRSYDETYETYLSISKLNPILKFLRVDETPETSSAKKFSLTLAIKAAQYENLLFIDADCSPSEQWAYQMSKRFSDNTEIVIGASPYASKSSILNYFIQFETGLTALNYLSFALAKVPYMSVGRNWGFKKHLFLNNKGHHPHNKLKGGDDDLFLQKVVTKNNFAICVHPDSLVVSIPKTSFTDWFEQKQRHYSVSKYYNFRTKFLLGSYLSIHLLSYILFVTLLFSQEFRLYSSAIFLCRLLLFWILSAKAFNKLASKVKWYFIPWLEFLNSIIVITFGLISLRARKIKWR
jgi:glycosyltransferase involved in cell wall biosynthesis